MLHSRVERRGRATFRAIAVATLFAATAVDAGVVARQMSFEEVLRGSDAVVVGTVSESAEFAQTHPKLGVIRNHTIQVEQYVKGDGPEEIVVVTRGGKYWADTPEGKRLREAVSSSAPQLPPEGTDALLFLRSWGNGYVIYSATHGVMALDTSPEGTRTVTLLFREPMAMPPTTLAAYENGLASGVMPGDVSYSGVVPVQDLKTIAQRALTADR